MKVFSLFWRLFLADISYNAGQKLPKIWHHAIFTPAEADAVSSHFWISRECLPEEIMKHPARRIINVKLIYQRQSYQAVCSTWQRLAFKAFTIFCRKATSENCKSRFCLSSCSTHCLINRSTKQTIFVIFIFNFPVSQFVRLITMSTNTLKNKQTPENKFE